MDCCHPKREGMPPKEGCGLLLFRTRQVVCTRSDPARPDPQHSGQLRVCSRTSRFAHTFSGYLCYCVELLELMRTPSLPWSLRPFLRAARARAHQHAVQKQPAIYQRTTGATTGLQVVLRVFHGWDVPRSVVPHDSSIGPPRGHPQGP